MVHDRPTCEFVWSRRLRLERIAELRGAIQAIDGQVSAITSTQQLRRRPNFDFVRKVLEVEMCFSTVQQQHQSAPMATLRTRFCSGLLHYRREWSRYLSRLRDLLRSPRSRSLLPSFLGCRLGLRLRDLCLVVPRSVCSRLAFSFLSNT